MEKTMNFSERIDENITRVWEVLQYPAQIVSEHNARLEMVDRMHWIQRESDEIENDVRATRYEETHRVHIVSTNSKYKSEGTDIVIQLEADGGGCLVHVQYSVKTTALLNMLALKTMGEKLEHHASNIIIKNIKKALI